MYVSDWQPVYIDGSFAGWVRVVQREDHTIEVQFNPPELGRLQVI